jgi:hypothetical protein
MHKKSLLARFAVLILIAAVCTGPAAAYLNYNIIWTSSGNQLVKENTLSGITSGTTPVHFQDGFAFYLSPSSSVSVITPFTSTINMNGPEPKVRTLFFMMNMPVGVNVTYVEAWNGPFLVSSKTVSWAGTGTPVLYTLDTGSYTIMNRGITTAMTVHNDLASDQNVRTYGAGAKLQW